MIIHCVLCGDVLSDYKDKIVFFGIKCNINTHNGMALGISEVNFPK